MIVKAVRKRVRDELRAGRAGAPGGWEGGGGRETQCNRLRAGGGGARGGRVAAAAWSMTPRHCINARRSPCARLPQLCRARHFAF
ncbi:hypothetical protein EVAR_32323_1 [Eumeta japonica]|uniref:Uncharacterized protein n=1 Tax=Eumeta variegata TaxID=151549 RepID=A0A4C1ZDM5_EUMVA|nr:hypothetical protein EVAR_32323_1 [Eumeta japonica]